MKPAANGKAIRQSSETFTCRQAGLELGMSEHTIRAWIARRRIAHLKLGRSIRVPVSEIDRLLSENLVPSRPER